MAPEGNLQGSLAAKAGRYRMEAHLPVNLLVLRRIDNIETAHPEHQYHEQENREHGKLTADGDPGAERTHTDGEAQKPVT